MKDVPVKVAANEKLYDGAYMLTVEGDLPPFSPGQFAMVEVPSGERILRRPFGIVYSDGRKCGFLYQVKGGGTRALTRLKSGDELKVLMPLGNGFPVSGGKVAVIGGGFGVAPLLSAARGCAEAGAEVRVYAGFAAAKKTLLCDRFAEVAKTTVCTDDGSAGFHGFPTAALEADMAAGFKPDVVLCCGPEPLMRAVKRLGESRGIPTYLSLERRMGCGVGACLTCTCRIAGHNKRVCKDGPVFPSTEVEL